MILKDCILNTSKANNQKENKMTKAKFKTAIKAAMKKYGIELDAAVKIAYANYPEWFDKIAEAHLSLTEDQMFGRA